MNEINSKRRSWYVKVMTCGSEFGRVWSKQESAHFLPSSMVVGVRWRETYWFVKLVADYIQSTIELGSGRDYFLVSRFGCCSHDNSNNILITVIRGKTTLLWVSNLRTCIWLSTELNFLNTCSYRRFILRQTRRRNIQKKTKKLICHTWSEQPSFPAMCSETEWYSVLCSSSTTMPVQHN